jgi:PAS domain S-box-containing protein
MFVVGVGTSSGDLETLQSFSQHAGADTSMTFVTFSEPARVCIEAGHVYLASSHLAPPHASVTVRDGVLILAGPEADAPAACAEPLVEDEAASAGPYGVDLAELIHALEQNRRLTQDIGDEAEELDVPEPRTQELAGRQSRKEEVCLGAISCERSSASDEVGAVSGLAVGGRDIPCRGQVQTDFEAAQQLLELISDAMPALLCYIDSDQRHRLVNKSFEHWFGMPRQAIIGLSVEELLGPKVFAQIAEYTERALAGEVISFEMQIECQSPRWVRADYVPDRAADGSVRGYVALVTDIEAQKRNEHALAEADRRKSEFLTVLAHELRNPLAAIRLGFTQLHEGGGSSAQQRDVEAIIDRQLGHLTRLVDDLLDLSRISTGKIDLRPRNLDARRRTRSRSVASCSSHARSGSSSTSPSCGPPSTPTPIGSFRSSPTWSPTPRSTRPRARP